MSCLLSCIRREMMLTTLRKIDDGDEDRVYRNAVG